MINKAIFEKTFSDFTRLKTIVVYLVFLTVPLLIFSGVASEGKLFAVTSLDLKAEYLFGFFSLFSFVWICGIALALLSIYFCASLISQEVSDRTILLLVTKPVKRVEIFMSKFLAFILAILLYSAFSLIVSVYIWASAFELDIFSLGIFITKMPLFFVYSVFVALFFGSMSAATSTVFSNKVKSIIPMVILVIITFFVYIQIRGIARSMDAYTGVLSAADIGYDFGNFYISLLESGGVKFIPTAQMIIGGFTGVYDIPDDGVKIDYDHGFVLPSLDRLYYRSTAASLLKLTILPILLTAAGLFIFSKRDIS